MSKTKNNDNSKPPGDLTEAEGVIVDEDGARFELEYIQKGGSKAKNEDKD